MRYYFFFLLNEFIICRFVTFADFTSALRSTVNHCERIAIRILLMITSKSVFFSLQWAGAQYVLTVYNLESNQD